jgi:hypothetical protein
MRQIRITTRRSIEQQHPDGADRSRFAIDAKQGNRWTTENQWTRKAELNS